LSEKGGGRWREKYLGKKNEMKRIAPRLFRKPIFCSRKGTGLEGEEKTGGGQIRGEGGPFAKKENSSRDSEQR